MVLIPPGEFLMGSTDEQVAAAQMMAEEIQSSQNVIDRIRETEQPQHRVVITKPFLMSATEVSIGQFKKFVEETRYLTEGEKYGSEEQKKENWRTPGYPINDDSPVAQVALIDARAYCKWISGREKTTYRLPTKAEWEYACRAGTTTQFWFGDTPSESDKYGWHITNAAGQPQPVGTKLPNPFGLFDLCGNLSEWCGDYFDEKWYEKSLSNDPTGPDSGTRCVIRGGAFGNQATPGRSASRSSYPPPYRSAGYGFRVVRVLDAPTTTASVMPRLSHQRLRLSRNQQVPLHHSPMCYSTPNKLARINSEAWAKHLGAKGCTTNSVSDAGVSRPGTDWLGLKLAQGAILAEHRVRQGWQVEGNALTTKTEVIGEAVLLSTTGDGTVD